MFDEKYFLFNYDEEHPAIYIPDEVKDDVDNDWIISIEKKDELISHHYQEIEELKVSHDHAKKDAEKQRK